MRAFFQQLQMDSVGSQGDIGTPIVSNGFVAPLSNLGSVDWFYEPVRPSRPLKDNIVNAVVAR